MRFRSTAARALAPALMSVLGLGAMASGVAIASVPAASAATAHHHTNSGWIRLAHLSPNTPPVDVYLYSFGNSHAMIVLHHVAYGTVSPYEKVTAGEYTVAMREVGASPTSQPVLSTSVQITAGGAYTVAGMGPAKGLRLQVIPDRLTTPPGKSLVRVIQASLHYQKITVDANHRTLAKNINRHHPHAGRAGLAQRPADRQPRGRRGQRGRTGGRREHRSGWHGSCPGTVPGAVGGPGRRRGPDRHRGRLPDAQGEERRPSRPLIRKLEAR